MQRLPTDTRRHVDILCRGTVFEGLSDDDLSALADIGTVRRYDAGETVFRVNEPAEGFHIIINGRAKIFRLAVDGREQVMHIYGPGSACGEVAMFQGDNYPATMAAVSELDTLFLARDRFLDVAKNRPELLMKMLALLSRRLRRFVQLVDDLSLKEVSARLANYILAESDRIGADSFALDISKSTLAARLGTVPETLSRTLKKFQTRGAIRISGKTIEIRNRDILKNIATGS